MILDSTTDYGVQVNPYPVTRFSTAITSVPFGITYITQQLVVEVTKLHNHEVSLILQRAHIRNGNDPDRKP